MEITADFLKSEIADLEKEVVNAQTFVIKAQAAIDVHKMLLQRLETPCQPSTSDTSGTEPK